VLPGCSRYIRTNWMAEIRLSEEWREAEVRRAFRPGAWPYIGFLLVTYCATSYSSDHPLVFSWFSTWIVLTSAVRLTIVYSARASLKTGSIWRHLVFGLLITSGLSWGAFLAVTIYLYHLDSSPSLLLLVCTAGITSGVITAYSPRFGLVICYLAGLLIPSIFVEFYLDHTLGKPMAVMSVLFLVFLIWQSRILNRSYWERAHGQVLLGKRADELTEANEALCQENRARAKLQQALARSADQLLQQQHELESRVAERTNELERAKQTAETARQAAETANFAKAEFLAKMSHEIRTPMHGVLGMTDLALTTDRPSELREYLEAIKTSSESLLQVINDVLDFSKIEAHKLTIDVRPFRLRDCIESCVAHLLFEAQRKSLPIFVEIDYRLPEIVVADPLRLRQVLTNLIHNAIKFTTSGQVHVTATREVSNDIAELHISVCDTGCGVAPEKQMTIFEAFTQADGSTTRLYGGTGLGLTISGELMRLMDGRIWVESTLGAGSIFHVVLPLPTQPKGSVGAASTASVDDDQMYSRQARA
jgi:signal transduction histidine kinase